MMLSVIVVLGLTATSSLGSLIGQCPKPKPMADFSLEKFAGTWYEIEHSPSVDSISSRCSRYIVDYKEDTKADLVHKLVSLITEKSKTEYFKITNSAKEPGRLEVIPLKGSIIQRPRSVAVVGTDYETYGILHSCEKKLITKYEETSIVSRSRVLDDKTKMAIYETMKKNGINQKTLMEVDQKHKDCKD